jgi:hypothetical protein
MSTATTDLNATVTAQVENIVATGTEVRPQLAKVVTQNACESQQSGEGLVGLTQAVMDGARSGLARAVPKNRDDVLRQVMDALGDGLSQTALAGQLAIQEAGSNSKHFEKGDLARLRDDLTAVRDLFLETVDRGLSSCKALTDSQLATARQHAERVAERLRPVLAQVHEAIKEHPAAFAKESLQAIDSMGQGATGALFQSLGRKLQRAGEQMRQEASLNQQ